MKAILKWLFTTPLGCIATLLGSIAVTPVALLALWMLIAWTSSSAGMSPERAFRRFVINPIPAGVSHIQNIGEYNLTGSDLVIMFEENPLLFPAVLQTGSCELCKPTDGRTYDNGYFHSCPNLEEAESFEDVPEAWETPQRMIKTNLSRTRVYYALTKD